MVTEGADSCCIKLAAWLAEYIKSKIIQFVLTTKQSCVNEWLTSIASPVHDEERGVQIQVLSLVDSEYISTDPVINRYNERIKMVGGVRHCIMVHSQTTNSVV